MYENAIVAHAMEIARPTNESLNDRTEANMGPRLCCSATANLYSCQIAKRASSELKKGRFEFLTGLSDEETQDTARLA